MFDLKFSSSVLDKMPVGTSFRDSDHEITKKDEGWECDDCSNPVARGRSSALMSDTSQEYALEKFAGAEIDPDNLDPRLLSFLPTGTKVADCDTLSSNNWHWYKTKAGLWVWDESQEGAETAASNGVGVENLGTLVHLRPFRLHSVGTNEAPESDGTPIDPARLTAAEATSLGAAVYDSIGGKWIYTSEGGYRLALGDDLLGKLREQLPEDYAPYSTEVPEVESAPEPEPEPKRIPESESDLTAAEATNFKDCRFRDRHDDVWLFDEETERWRFIRSDGTLSCLFRYERLDAFLEPYVLIEGETEAETEPETEVDPAEELSAEQADEKRDFVLSDTDDDKWTYSDGNWHCEGHEHLSVTRLPDMFEPYEVVEPIEAPEPEAEPAVKTMLSAKEASEHKDTVFEDSDGDAWFFDYGLQRWRGIGPGWAHAKEELDGFHSPYSKVGPLSEYERTWTAGEANDLKDNALEDRGGDTWIYDAPSEMWKCSHSSALDYAELDEAFQPYRIKKAASSTAAPKAFAFGFDEPFQLSGDTEEVTFEGSAKEAVELLDRIARSLESISNKLGDK